MLGATQDIVMPIIQALEKDERRPERYHLRLDDGRTLTLHESLVVSERLTPGRHLDEATIARLDEMERERALVDRGARYLATRPRSSLEVRRRLLRPAPGKESPSAEAVERALDRLAEFGYLNDAAFAQYWTEQRDRFNPRSARAVRLELRQRGIDDETAAASATSDDDEERAVTAGRKRLRALAQTNQRDFTQRMGGFLQRRGFGYGVARAAIRRLWDEVRAEYGEATESPDGQDDMSEGGIEDW
jgi:regulatory protein